MTKTLLRQIVTLFLVAMGMTACVFDHYEDAEDVVAKHEGEEKVVMLFQVNTMASSSTDENGVSEKIKSLRIFVLNEDSIECNRLIQIDSNVDAVDFSYDFQWWTKPGVKQLIVIANEESISELSYIPVVTDEPDLGEKAEELPATLPTNLTELLNLYRNDSEYSDHWNAQELKEVMNAIAFKPEYTVNDKKEIFLPYAVSYAEIKARKAEMMGPMPIYLVPVATKFIFKFSNSRSHPVDINGISLAYTNASNYLLGQVGEDDFTKQYDGKDLYWVDWLAEVSKKSWGYQGFSDNENFNESEGWIVNYSVPNPEDCRQTTFVGTELNNTFTIPEGKKITGKTEEDETIEPGTYSTSVFYIPESINKTRLENGDESDDTDDGQRFYLTLKMKDNAPNATAPPFENVVIPNLKALFRNTYVIITINMSEGDVELYAEIASWNEKTAYGHVAEGDAPTNNPFKIIGK